MRPVACIVPTLALLVPTLALLATGGCRTQHVVGETVVPGDADGGARDGAGVDTRDAPEPDGAAVDALALNLPCDPFAPGNDLAVCTASYLGSPAADEAGNVAVAPDGTLILGATASGADLGATPTTLLAGGAGAVYRLRADGRKVLTVSRIGGRVFDLAVEPGRGRIAVVGSPFGVAVLSPDGGAVLWHRPVEGQHVAVGSDGTVAVLDGTKGTVTVLDADGAPRGSFTIAGATANDLAVVGAQRLVVVVGEIFYTGTSVRQPLLQAFSYMGLSRWRAYGWTDAEASSRSLTAATRGVRVTLGLDGRLYYLGESHGGNTVHQRNPRKLEEPADNVVTDEYNFPYNTSNQVLYVARFRPDNGTFERGQFLLTRERASAPAMGNSVFAGAISADERGQVLVGGKLRCCLEDVERKTIRGTPSSGGSDQEAFALLVSADFKTRWVWTSFGRGGGSEVNGVALRAGTAAVVGLHTGKSMLITYEALQPIRGGGATEAFFSVWSTP